MNTGRGIDYKGTCFDYPEITKIHGEPTLGGMIDLEGQIDANAMTVHTSLGGGQHGHLGLTKTQERYAEIEDTEPYQRPVNPGILEVEGGTAFEIAQQKAQHDEATRLFREVLGVERALIQQIISAIDNKFLQALKNPVTGKIDRTIPEIFEYLYANFGNVSPDELSDLRDDTQKMTFDVKEPVDTVFTAVDKVAEIARIAQSPITDQQKIDMGYIIMKKAKPFQSSLLKWDIRPAQEKTWNEFKIFFRRVQVALRKAGSLTVEDGINHSELVNMVSQGVKQAIEDTNQPQEESVNNVQNENILGQLEEMKEMMAQLAAENQALQASKAQPQKPPASFNNSTNNQNFHDPPTPYFRPRPYNQNSQGYHHHQRGRGYGRGRFQQGRGGARFGQRFQQRRGYYGPQPYQQNQRQYCWTHGVCSHNSTMCNTPSEGHQRFASFQNRMGGNTRGL